VRHHGSIEFRNEPAKPSDSALFRNALFFVSAKESENFTLEKASIAATRTLQISASLTPLRNSVNHSPPLYRVGLPASQFNLQFASGGSGCRKI
jgi:hypothetical protein